MLPSILLKCVCMCVHVSALVDVHVWMQHESSRAAEYLARLQQLATTSAALQYVTPPFCLPFCAAKELNKS